MKQLKVNKAYERLYTQKKRYKHCAGGRGAGRTYEIAQYNIIKTYLPEYSRGIIARQHYADIRGSQWQQLIDIIEDKGLSSDFHILDHTMTLINLQTGNRITAKGFKAASGSATAKMKSLTEITHVWIEEADEVGKEDFDKLDKSLRSTKGSGLEILLSYNTDNEDIWLKSEFHDKHRDDTLIIHTTYKDNIKNLHPDYVKMLERLLEEDPEAAKSDVLGLWGGGKRGKVYDNWLSADKMPESFKSECYGLDFGFTNDPTALVHIRYSEGNLYIQQRMYDYGMTNPEICLKMRELSIDKKTPIYADSADPKSIKEIAKEGFLILPAEKGPNSILEGIGKVKQYQVYVVNSPDIQKENKNYIWQKDSMGKATNKPIDRWNHAKDAIRYGVVGMLGKPRPKPNTMTIPGARQL